VEYLCAGVVAVVTVLVTDFHVFTSKATDRLTVDAGVRRTTVTSVTQVRLVTYTSVLTRRTLTEHYLCTPTQWHITYRAQ